MRSIALASSWLPIRAPHLCGYLCARMCMSVWTVGHVAGQARRRRTGSLFLALRILGLCSWKQP